MRVFSPTAMSGDYALQALPPIGFAPVDRALAGTVRIAAGRRSPEVGMRTSAEHELGYVIQGQVRVDTADGTYEARAGDVLVLSPAVAHATTAIEDSELFFVLLAPHSV